MLGDGKFNFKKLYSFSFLGHNCETNINECASEPCVHGNCIDGIGEYHCICDIPFTGVNCTQEMNPCQSNLCTNGAQCIPEDDYRNFICQCPLGFIGMYTT